VGLRDDLTSPPMEPYAVTNDNVTKLVQPGAFEDSLTEILRSGARALLAQAIVTRTGRDPKGIAQLIGFLCFPSHKLTRVIWLREPPF
jgi:hypothetical protein